MPKGTFHACLERKIKARSHDSLSLTCTMHHDVVTQLHRSVIMVGLLSLPSS